MRWKLLKRRMSISAPRMTVRSHLPWPLRWAVMAVVFGLSAALALWAFEFGKGIAGLDSNAKQELAELRSENAALREEQGKLSSTANTADSLLKTERATQDRLATQIKQLEAENSQLKDDLRFFERLIPANEAQSLAIRALQVETSSPGVYNYRMLVIQTGKNPPDFQGRYEFVMSGTQAGKPWAATFPDAPRQSDVQHKLSFKAYQRVQGTLTLPEGTVLKSLQARVIDRAGVRSTQTARL
jgi:hypothetical protein